jgi:hypothetical protein
VALERPRNCLAEDRDIETSDARVCTRLKQWMGRRRWNVYVQNAFWIG